jgi:hypothetical protein
MYLWEDKAIKPDTVEHKITKVQPVTQGTDVTYSSFTATVLQTLAIDAQTWFDSPP